MAAWACGLRGFLATMAGWIPVRESGCRACWVWRRGRILLHTELLVGMVVPVGGASDRARTGRHRYYPAGGQTAALYSGASCQRMTRVRYKSGHTRSVVPLATRASWKCRLFATMRGWIPVREGDHGACWIRRRSRVLRYATLLSRVIVPVDRAGDSGRTRRNRDDSTSRQAGLPCGQYMSQIRVKNQSRTITHWEHSTIGRLDRLAPRASRNSRWSDSTSGMRSLCRSGWELE